MTDATAVEIDEDLVAAAVAHVEGEGEGDAANGDAAPAAAAAADSTRLCGACSGPLGDAAGHPCMMVRADEKHVKVLHTRLICSEVVMPIEGYYFCNMTCLHTYNAWLEAEHGAVNVMPDEGVPLSSNQDDFVLPARPSPDAPLQPRPRLVAAAEDALGATVADPQADPQAIGALAAAGEEEEEAAEEEEAVGGGSELEAATAAEAEAEAEEEEDEAAAAGLTAVVGMRFVLYEDHGSVVAIVERSGRVIVVYDDCEP
jgi:hypothetical protein